MTVVAFSCEIGTNGNEIAIEVSRRLDIPFVDADAIADGVVRRLSAAAQRHSAGREGWVRSWRRQLGVHDRVLARHAADEITELAAYGHVALRGWGAPIVLSDRSHVVRVRLRAATEVRIATLAARQPGVSRAALRQCIEHSDRSLGANLEPVLGAKWRRAGAYDLVVDTHADTPARLAHDIAEAVRRTRKLRLQTWSGASGGVRSL